MRTLLKHTRNGLFFQGPDKWTDNPDLGYDFKFTQRALQYVATWDLTEVELAFAFEDTRAISCASLEKLAAQPTAA